MILPVTQIKFEKGTDLKTIHTNIYQKYQSIKAESAPAPMEEGEI
ncbi:hypothetical protein [Cytobacillus firmus]|nr:hypothetical protein [Cytobacillus firmus]